MYIDSNIRKKKRSNSKWLIFIFYMIFIFTIEPFFRQPLYDISEQLILDIQGSDPKNSFLINCAELISHIGSNFLFVPILIIVYNYANIYKAYTLLLSLLIPIGGYSILKVIYVSPRPFFKNENIQIFGCECGWGNPSGRSFNSMAFFLTLWKIMIDCKQIRDKKLVKFIFLIFTCLLVILIMFSCIILGSSSINQVLFGGLLGLGVYFFLFYVLCIRPNDHRQFSVILNFRNIIYFILNLIIFLFVFIIFKFNQINGDIQSEFEKNISAKCPDTPENLRFHKEALVNFGIFLSNIGAFVGIKFDYFFSFRENLENWYQFNFELSEPKDDSSLMTKITLNRETQWNHTNIFYSILRLFLIIVFSSVMMFPYFFFDWNDNIALVFIFKLVLPTNMLAFCYFYLFKVLLKSLKMVNLSMYSLSESI